MSSITEVSPPATAGTTTTRLTSTPRTKLYLAGVHVTHSIAPPMHNHIARTLFPSLPKSEQMTFTNAECPTINSVLELFRASDFAGGVVTMPYKQEIIEHLDEVDPLVDLLGACNNVHLTPDGRLRGSNTDWRGVKGCLRSGEKALEQRKGTGREKNDGKGKVGMIIGAGGASRAAVYALSVDLGCSEIYIVNRDASEVEALIASTKSYSSFPDLTPPKITHLTALPSPSLTTPTYLVGTVPDFAPSTPSELLCRDILVSFLDRPEKGVILDMCFKPRNTRTLKMARERGWECVAGTGVIGWQIEEQWRLWVGAGEGKGVGEVPVEKAWEILQEQAEKSSAINF